MTSVLVKIDQGTLKGKTATDLNGKEYYAFFRIPYAKPPIGTLRFKAPQPAEKWSGIRIANDDGNECFSRDMDGKIIGSEDCLVLNVYTPQLPKNAGKLRPVMVWIHGGGFTMGSNSSLLYGPDYLITEDVLIVAINYRLGVLGFLSFEDPSVEVPGNAACKDTVMALKWVQANIKDFGGDPDNVTIFGESAGGVMAHLLVLSSMATGLFHKAILQSGCALNPWCLGKSCGKELAQILNCPYNVDKDILRYLQELTPEKLLEGQEQLLSKFTLNTGRFVRPIVEKNSKCKRAFLTENPLDILVEGKYNKVPLMMGYTTREGYVYNFYEKMVWQKQEEAVDVESNIPNNFFVEKDSDASNCICRKIRDFYFDGNTSSERTEGLCLLRTDTCFLRGLYKSAKHHAATSTEPVYFYRFSVDAGLNVVKMIADIKCPGAAHGDDLGYLFKTVHLPANLIQPGSVDETTIRRMVKLWTNFAKFGNPNPVDDVVWKPVMREEVNFLDIGEMLTSDVNPEKERMELWDSIVQLIPGSCKN